MMKQMGAQGSRIRLPLNQTVFLPREAMGVRYIDKVRTAVFVEKLSAGEQGLWLRGLYELDLEYQGMEGGGLHKHRVSLPLKVATPEGWPGCVPQQQVEPGELHTAIKKPMIRLLSPYVLEFCAELQIEYLGEARWQEDKLPPPPPAPRHIWCDELQVPDATQADRRLESKIDRFFVGRVADDRVDSSGDVKPGMPAVSTAGRIPDWPGVADAQAAPEAGSETAKAPEHTLPVWRYVPQKAEEPVAEAVAEAGNAETVEKLVEKPVESAVENLVKSVAKKTVAKDPAKEQIWAPALNRNRFRAILTAAAIARIKARGENLLAAANNANNNVANNNNANNNVEMEPEEKGADVILTEEILTENKEVDEVTNKEVAEELAVEAAEVAEAAENVGATEVAEAAEAVEKVEEVSVEEVGAAGAEVTEVTQDEPGVQLVNSRGVKVRLTARQVAPPRQEPARPASSFAIRYYVVKPGDDAMHIALKHNISLERLREANRLPDGELAAGTLLRIPR